MDIICGSLHPLRILRCCDNVLGSVPLVIKRLNLHMPLERPAIAVPSSPSVSCSTCRANCCKLEVLLMGEDDVPDFLIHIDRWGGHVMARLDDGWCAALDRETLLCGIYERRPTLCRDYELGGSDCLQERNNTAPSPIKFR